MFILPNNLMYNWKYKYGSISEIRHVIINWLKKQLSYVL